MVNPAALLAVGDAAKSVFTALTSVAVTLLGEYQDLVVAKLQAQLRMLAAMVAAVIATVVLQGGFAYVGLSEGPGGSVLRLHSDLAPPNALASAGAHAGAVWLSAGLLLLALLVCSLLIRPIMLLSLAWVVALRASQLLLPLLALASAMRLYHTQMVLQYEQFATQQTTQAVTGQVPDASLTTPPLRFLLAFSLLLLRVALQLRCFRGVYADRWHRLSLDVGLHVILAFLHVSFHPLHLLRVCLLYAIQLECEAIRADREFWAATVYYIANQDLSKDFSLTALLLRGFRAGAMVYHQMPSVRSCQAIVLARGLVACMCVCMACIPSDAYYSAISVAELLVLDRVSVDAAHRSSLFHTATVGAVLAAFLIGALVYDSFCYMAELHSDGVIAFVTGIRVPNGADMAEAWRSLLFTAPGEEMRADTPSRPPQPWVVAAASEMHRRGWVAKDALVTATGTSAIRLPDPSSSSGPGTRPDPLPISWSQYGELRDEAWQLLSLSLPVNAPPFFVHKDEKKLIRSLLIAPNETSFAPRYGVLSLARRGRVQGQESAQQFRARVLKQQDEWVKQQAADEAIDPNWLLLLAPHPSAAQPGSRSPSVAAKEAPAELTFRLLDYSSAPAPPLPILHLPSKHAACADVFASDIQQATDNADLTKRVALQPTDLVIALFGATGGGKSGLATALTGHSGFPSGQASGSTLIARAAPFSRSIVERTLDAGKKLRAEAARAFRTIVDGHESAADASNTPLRYVVIDAPGTQQAVTATHRKLFVQELTERVPLSGLHTRDLAHACVRRSDVCLFVRNGRNRISDADKLAFDVLIEALVATALAFPSSDTKGLAQEDLLKYVRGHILLVFTHADELFLQSDSSRIIEQQQRESDAEQAFDLHPQQMIWVCTARRDGGDVSEDGQRLIDRCCETMGDTVELLKQRIDKQLKERIRAHQQVMQGRSRVAALQQAVKQRRSQLAERMYRGAWVALPVVGQALLHGPRVLWPFGGRGWSPGCFGDDVSYRLHEHPLTLVVTTNRPYTSQCIKWSCALCGNEGDHGDDRNHITEPLWCCLHEQHRTDEFRSGSKFTVHEACALMWHDRVQLMRKQDQQQEAAQAQHN